MSGQPDTVVEIENLSSGFRVAGRTSYVHRNLDLRIAQGELLSIVGGSGSGKTTLLRQMLGLERPAAWACCSSTARCSPPSA